MPESKVSTIKGRFTGQLQRVVTNPGVGPKSIDRVIWIRMGDRVQLDMGHVDFGLMQEIAQLNQPPETENARVAGVPLWVTDRFVLSIEAVRALFDSMEALRADLERDGLLEGKQN